MLQNAVIFFSSVNFSVQSVLYFFKQQQQRHWRTLPNFVENVRKAANASVLPSGECFDVIVHWFYRTSAYIV